MRRDRRVASARLGVRWVCVDILRPGMCAALCASGAVAVDGWLMVTLMVLDAGDLVG